MYIWFFFSAFYSAGCWIALPEIMLKKKYKCSDNYKLSKTIWTIRDFLLTITNIFLKKLLKIQKWKMKYLCQTYSLT